MLFVTNQYINTWNELLRRAPADESGGGGRGEGTDDPEASHEKERLVHQNLRYTMCIANQLSIAIVKAKPNCNICSTPNACHELVAEVERHIKSLHEDN